jgi:hypothetical protein
MRRHQAVEMQVRSESFSSVDGYIFSQLPPAHPEMIEPHIPVDKIQCIRRAALYFLPMESKVQCRKTSLVNISVYALKLFYNLGICMSCFDF